MCGEISQCKQLISILTAAETTTTAATRKAREWMLVLFTTPLLPAGGTPAAIHDILVHAAAFLKPIYRYHFRLSLSLSPTTNIQKENGTPRSNFYGFSVRKACTPCSPYSVKEYKTTTYCI